MVENFFDMLNAEEKQRVKERTATLADLLEEWAQQYPVIRPIRLPMIALTSAVSMPRVMISDALTWAQMVTLMFALNDVANPETFTPEDMRRQANHWYSIANTWPSSDVEHEGDTQESRMMTMIVMDMTRDLSKSCLFDSLRGHWASRFRDYVMAFAKDCQYSIDYRAMGPRAWPVLDEYLRGAINSIGFPPLSLMALILQRDSSVLALLEPISQVVECASAAIRFYNDVASLDRERLVGDINSILIMRDTMLSKDPSADREKILAEAKQSILQLGDFYAQRCYDLIGQLRTDTGQIEETCYQLVALHAQFYGHTEQDYHTTPSAKVYHMFDERAA